MSGILLAIGYTALLLLVMRRTSFFSTVPGLGLRTLSCLFVLKILAGTALWAIYTWVYTDRVHADVFKYFDDSAIMFGALQERPGDFLRMLFSVGNDNTWFDERYYKVMNHWYREYESNLHNDAHTIIRFNAALRLLSFGEFHVHTVFAAFLSFTGMVGIHKVFVDALPGRERALAFAIFLLPSVLFWASGVIKESLLFFGLGMLLLQFFRLLDGRMRTAGAVLLMTSAILLFHLKLYVMLSLIPALAMLALARIAPRVPMGLRNASVLVLIGVIGLNLHFLLPGFNVLETLAVKQRDFIGLSHATDPGSFVMPTRLEPTLMSFVLQAPNALLTSLAGPLLHPGPGAFGALAALENLAILIFFALVVTHRTQWRAMDRELLAALATYVIMMALVIGWTTPVMGAVVRYRTPMLPFLLISGLLIMDHRKLVARWPRTKPLFTS